MAELSSTDIFLLVKISGENLKNTDQMLEISSKYALHLVEAAGENFEATIGQN